MLNDEVTVERLNKVYEELKAEKPEMTRSDFDVVAVSVLKMFEHRLGNVQQVSNLRREMYQRAKEEHDALKVKFQEQRVHYEQNKALISIKAA